MVVKKGAFVGIDTQDLNIVAGEIYAVNVPYEGLVLKRVFVDPAGRSLRLVSTNPDHPEQVLPLQDQGNLIAGRAIWVMLEI